MILILIAFVIYFFLSVFYFENLPKSEKNFFLLIICGVIAFIIGMRNPYGWSDTSAYVYEFIADVKTLGNLLPTDGPRIYAERGFYYIGVLVKTYTKEPSIYLLTISILTFAAIYKVLGNFSIYPFIGMYIYLGRFVNRNTIQIRAALAIAIVIIGTIYITKKRWWIFLLFVFIASRFHTSAYIALPLVLMKYIKIKKNHIYIGILFALVLALFGGATINSIISTSDLANEWARSYIEEGSEKAWSNDLTNPMIWYQIIILLTFTMMENPISNYTKHYYMIRNAYFYSTLIIVLLCQYAILAGRLSTIFATFEVAIIPFILKALEKQYGKLPLFVVFVVYLIFFFINIRSFF